MLLTVAPHSPRRCSTSNHWRIAEVRFGGGRTSIDWSSTFEPRGVETVQAAQMIEGIYRMFIARLKETLAS